MGKALYRKYRSKNLDEVIGQKHITNTLNKALEKGAISHAYLFTGPKGVGKTSVARILAHEINGLAYDDESTHLDIIEIDAASNRRIDEIRDLREKVHIAPTSAKYKVYIIDEVHMLTREAFNALLKTLEEPPEHVVFILATTEAHKVPDTIISRTQQFSFKPIDNEHAVLHLRTIAEKEGLEIEDESLNLIAKHGNGSFRDSISMLDQLAGLNTEIIRKQEVLELLGIPDVELIKSLINSVASADSTQLFETMAKLRENGASPTNLSNQVILELRDQLINGTNGLDSQKVVDLMKSLLPTTGAHGSFEAIEIALLDAITFENANESKTINDRSNKAKMNEALISDKVSTVVTIEQPKELDEQISEPGEIVKFGNKDWDSVLHALKAKHNTLYGVLRMADVDITDGKITLTFKFEFHKKQLKQNKNLDVLHGVIVDSLGKKHELELVVKKQPKQKVEISKGNDNNKAISSVSNIFGGAELLES